jgi:hypothetical protein
MIPPLALPPLLGLGGRDRVADTAVAADRQRPLQSSDGINIDRQGTAA